jgi:hypothetical protein
LIVLLSLAIPAHLAGDATVRVDESKTRLQIGASKSDLKLAVTNASRRGLSTQIQLDLLDPEDLIVKTVSHESVLRPGFNLLEIPLGSFFSGPSKGKEAGILWFRLRYQLKPAGEANAVVGGASRRRQRRSNGPINPEPLRAVVPLIRGQAED